MANCEYPRRQKTSSQCLFGSLMGSGALKLVTAVESICVQLSFGQEVFGALLASHWCWRMNELTGMEAEVSLYMEHREHWESSRVESGR